jgi:hypothetical protein
VITNQLNVFMWDFLNDYVEFMLSDLIACRIFNMALQSSDPKEPLGFKSIDGDFFCLIFDALLEIIDRYLRIDGVFYPTYDS